MTVEEIVMMAVDGCARCVQGNVTIHSGRIMVRKFRKSSKESLEQMYRGIIEKKGRKWDDCKVLSFVFKSQAQAELFHYGLMNEKPDYFVFDCWERHANVIVPNDEQNAAVIIAIAEKDGGEKTTPNLR